MPSIIPLDLAARVRRTHPSPLAFKASGSNIAINGYCLRWATFDDCGAYYSATGLASLDAATAVPLLAGNSPDHELGECRLSADTEGVFVEATVDPERHPGIESALRLGHYDGLSATLSIPEGAQGHGAAGPACVTRYSVLAIGLVKDRHPMRRMTAGQGPILLKSKAELVDGLRASGLSRAAAERVAGGGWAALHSEAPSVDSVNTSIAKLTQALSEPSHD